MSDELHRFDILRSLTRRAGWLARDRFGRARVDFKDDDSMLTDADEAVERWLDEQIAAAFPEDCVIGEEHGSNGVESAAAWTWVVDPIDGTNKEFELLARLMDAPGRVVGRTELLDLVWGRDGFVEPHTVDVHPARLRAKFIAADVPPPSIETVRGVGYRLRDPDAP